MAELINGWTRETVIARINEKFKGKSVFPEEGAGPESCAYRNGEGLSCIAGCFISDEDYDTFFKGDAPACYEGESVWDLHPNIVGKFPLEQRDMARWQRVHDGLNPELSVDEQKKILINELNNILSEEEEDEI